MLKKIISGGQTGADRAALDVALKFNIPHGGWIPKGRITEEGRLPDKYQLQEMPTKSYPARTEQNVIDSDGTLIFSRGEPTGGTVYTRKMVHKHKKHIFHIDLNLATSFDAASLILQWIDAHKIKTLNVAGPRASKDPEIYEDVFKILEMAYKIGNYEYWSPPENQPKTVDEAIEWLLFKLSSRDKLIIANMAKDDLITLQFSLGTYIGREFGIWSGNRYLLHSCVVVAGDPHLYPDYASTVIIEELWNQLQETHKLRAVK